MRIAVSGSHRVGKTTLADALADALPRYEVVPEPYHLLEEDGYECAAMPSLGDFERQLDRSIQCVQEGSPNTIFDRCPLDIVGYLLTHRDSDTFQLERWLPKIQPAVARLAFMVFVPIEQPDRIAVSQSDVRLRADVDTVLGEIIVDDSLGLGFHAITVAGTTATRVRQVIANLG